MATPDTQPNKKQVQYLVDRISELPDGILSHMLSFLKLKDAVRTSALSKRWIDTWEFTKRLDFDERENLKQMSPSGNVALWRRMERLKPGRFIEWVNKVLQSHKSMDLDRFKISCSLEESHRDHLHNWILYAFARKVQNFELDLGETFPNQPFKFPGQLLAGFKSLRSLTLKRISVSGEEIEFMLHNCPFLEHLLVHMSWNLKELKVCGSSIALKHLEINYCYELSSLIICDTNIVSLRTNEGSQLVLKNVPMLVDVSVTQHAFGLTYSIGDAISWISCCLLNLEAITLNASLAIDGVNWEVAEAGIPQVTQLKQFTLIANLDKKDESVLSYTSFIRASPNIKKFILKLECCNRTVFEGRESKKGVRMPLQHLKVVELQGYYGSKTEVELVEYFIENGVALERIVVDPRIHYMILSMPHEIDPNEQDEPERKEDRIARNLATQQLQNLVPSNIELAIL